jgi:hypothetical protein
MKKCSYCGAEYPDDATVCVVDQTPLDKTHFTEEPPARINISFKMGILLVAGAISALSLILLLFSYHEGGPRLELGFKIPPFISFGFDDGHMILDSRQHPYSGSDTKINDDGSATYEGGRARGVKDWDWHLGVYGIFQRRFIGKHGEFIAKDRVLLLPGIYYRHFEWEQERVLWSIICSMWYPVLLPVLLPLIFVIQRLRRRKHDA